MVLTELFFKKTHISNIINRFDIGSSGQQVHISFGSTDPKGTRHPCFKLSSREDLEEIKTSIYNHHVRGGPAAPMSADKPGEENSGEISVIRPRVRLFADYCYRSSRERISHTVLRSGFCWKQA